VHRAMATAASVGADVSCGGQSLNIAQRLAVASALTKLKVNEKLTQVTFWGKITGVSNDYLIAASVAASTSVAKRFYFSADGGVTFARLTPADEWVRDKAKNVFSKVAALLFTGNPAHEYRDPNAPPEDPDQKSPAGTPPQSPKEPKPVDPSKRKMTELERLSYTVETIERATCVVPRGVWYLTPTGDIQTNPQFRGLTSFESKRLESFSLFRAPEHASTLARVRAQGLHNCIDFLDRIGDDTDKGVWSLQTDESAQTVTLRHFEWPGFEFTHNIGSTACTRAYFGNGEKNADVNFML